MNIIIRKVIGQLTVKPGLLFLIDGLGALLTAFFLFAVLGTFSEYVGMPVWILNSLSLIALCFCIYSAACFFFLRQNRVPFILGIGIANLLYVILTLVILILHFPILSVVGIGYFLVEIVVMLALVYLELSLARAVRLNKVEIS